MLKARSWLIAGMAAVAGLVPSFVMAQGGPTITSMITDCKDDLLENLMPVGVAALAVFVIAVSVGLIFRWLKKGAKAS